MAVALERSTFSGDRTTVERRPPQLSVRLAVVAVIATLVALAVASGAWISSAVVAALFVVGTALLAAGDEPLSLRQVLSIGAVHLVAAGLLAL